MIDYENLRVTVVKGLKKYLKCPVIKNNQNAEPPPYPYVSYTITTLATANNGTYGVHSDGTARKPIGCIWSITAQSDDNIESVTLANKARDWLDYVGTVYLNDNNVIVQSVGSVGNRDNVITAEYEYKNGFDCTFSLFDVIEIPEQDTIDLVELGEEDIIKKLERRLDGVERFEFSGNTALEDVTEELNSLLEERLYGVE